MRLARSRALFFAIVAFALTAPARADWKPAEGPLKTRWAKDVSPTNALPEYPRPQLVREKWLNLNGLWQFSSAKEGEQPPIGKDLHEQILVPYPVESSLSGLMRHEERMWYRRTFQVPGDWKGEHVLLHFGAVDWEADVYVNGKHLGSHKGGYDGFSFDVTDALKGDGPQELIVGVYDPTNQRGVGNQPRGKQVLRPGGIFYTPTSGIWETVWIEPTPASHIRAVHVDAPAERDTVRVRIESSGPGSAVVRVLDGQTEVARKSGPAGSDIELAVPNGKLWSPDSPFLYGLDIQFTGNDGVADHVTSYFGKRSIALQKDGAGFTRIALNGKPIFQTGPLDQGFWPDGIYTAPTDEALRYDIEITKKLGFNMTRKHVKVEPERWYYWADKLGLLVWQDMPAGDNRSPESKVEFEQELDHMIAGRREHPSIVMWVVFNEGWGQFDTERLTKHVKELDPTRLVDNASGWTDQNVGDVHDMHHYPEPSMPAPEPNRAVVLGEFGGLGLALEGHTWTKNHWGYRGVQDPADLTTQYERLLARGWRLRDKGLCALVYTQITDVETECNGLLTYDRQIIKVDPARAAAVNAGHVENIHIPEPLAVVPSAQQEPAEWRYTFDKPADGWLKPNFDDASWKLGRGGFGTEGTPGSIVNTKWDTADIWIRRSFTLREPLKNPMLWLHHDEDAEIYINGALAARPRRYSTEYLPVTISPDAKATLKQGKNVIAIHCHQTTGGQYIDAGIVEMK